MQEISHPKDLDLNKIENFIYNNLNSNLFQSIRAYNFFKSVDQYEPLLLFILKDDDEIIGSLLTVIIYEGKWIKRYLSRRCVVWGGPVIINNDKNVACDLLKKLDKEIGGKVIYSEFRNVFDMSPLQEAFEKNGFYYKPHYNFIVHIEKIHSGWKKISASKKRQINKSMRSGAMIIEPKNIDQVKQFFQILQNLYKTKVKKPLPDFDFFKAFYLDPSLGKYFLIEYQEKIIGGIMCPIYKDTIYEWYICGLDGQYKNVYPSVLTTWAPIDYAMKNGLKYFDFMGAGSPDDDYGVREFKSKFGGDLVEYGRFIRINKPLLYWIGKIWLRVLGWVGKVTREQSNKGTK